MEYEVERITTAEPARLRAAVVDIERWPRWIPIYSSVRRLDEGRLAVGSRAEVRQAGLSPATYVVTALRDGREFTWESTVAGVRTVARHAVEPGPSGGARLRLAIDQTGLLAGVVGMLLGKKIRRYVDLEAQGLCAAAEGDAEPPLG
jgi:hypothetical protein